MGSCLSTRASEPLSLQTAPPACSRVPEHAGKATAAGTAPAAANPDQQDLVAELADLTAHAEASADVQSKAEQLVRQPGQTALRPPQGSGAGAPSGPVGSAHPPQHASRGAWEIEYQALKIVRQLGIGTFGPASGRACSASCGGVLRALLALLLTPASRLVCAGAAGISAWHDGGREGAGWWRTAGCGP